MHGERGKIGYLKMWGYKNELLLPHNPWFLLENNENSCYSFFSFLSYFFYYHGHAETYNYLCVYFLLKYIPIL